MTDGGFLAQRQEIVSRASADVYTSSIPLMVDGFVISIYLRTCPDEIDWNSNKTSTDSDREEARTEGAINGERAA